MQCGKLRLVLVHGVVKALDQGSYGRFAAHMIEG
jgi:hypothetical protein